MKTNISAARIWMLAAGAIGFTGCADYVGVGAGYTSAYYVPDYRPYYVDYFYDGAPWWGPNYYYTRKKIVVKDVDKHVDINKNIYYGGHHLVRDWPGKRTFAHANAFRHHSR